MGGLDRAIRLGLFCSQIQEGRAGDALIFQNLQDGPIGLAFAVFTFSSQKPTEFIGHTATRLARSAATRT